jgi:quercetin dioxygenase-like cupin family protein
MCAALAGCLAAAYAFTTWSAQVQAPLYLAAPAQPSLPVFRPVLDSAPQQTLGTLRTAVMPYDDPYDRYCRLWSYCNIAPTVAGPSRPYEVGARRLFWIWDSDVEEYHRSPAVLRRITDHAYLWIGESVDYQESDAVALMAAFEEQIYPTSRRLFGAEWSPGVDNDPHVYVLYVAGMGSGLGGRFDAADEINPRIYYRSNAAELYQLNAETMRLGAEYTRGTLATGFQRLIQWNSDKTETAWLESGLTEMAALANGYNPGSSALVYARDPAISLLDFADLEESPDLWRRHTGQKLLFIKYIWDRFGSDVVHDIASDPGEGLESLNRIFKDRGITDPDSGSIITAEDVALDWMLAMYLDDPAIGDGRYAFSSPPRYPRLAPTRHFEACPNDTLYGATGQYAPEYIEILCPGESTIVFTGSTATRIVPTEPHSGKYAFWSNVGDSAYSTLTREFDLTGLSGSIELSYWLWYDIQGDSDGLSVQASTDGETWQLLKTASCASDDPYSTASDCAYEGLSSEAVEGAWIQDRVDLFAYAGQKVLVRFEYDSSSSHAGKGALLDDIELPKLDYRTDFEAGEGDWESQGFARIQNILPQTYRLGLAITGVSGSSVQYIDVGENQTAKFPLSLRPWERAVLLVMASQPYTHLPTGYELQITGSRTHSQVGDEHMSTGSTPQVLPLLSLITYQPEAVVSRQITKADAGNVTLFAFDAGQELSEHTAPFDALVHILEGEAEVRIGGAPSTLQAGDAIVMPSGIPHALKAVQRFKMLLTMIRA